MLCRAGWMVLVVLVSAATARGQSPPTHVDVFVSGTEGYFAYRIPAIETAADGSLLAVAEARKYNLDDPGFGKQDIDLVVRRSTDKGQTWSPMMVVEDPGELWSAANPTTVVDRQTGRIWLFYLQCKPQRNTHTARPGTDDSRVLARTSDDHGVTWSDPIDLTAVSRDMNDAAWRVTVIGPGGGIQDRSGRLLLPAWKFEPYRVFTLYSDDRGVTWKRGEFVPGDDGVNESQLVELADGRVLFDMRQTEGTRRWMSVSGDRGATWSRPYPGNEVSPVACAVERFPAGVAAGERDRVLWTGPKGPGRRTLVLRTSHDQGRTFQHERILADEPAAYSDLTVLNDGSVGCLWERDEYKYVTFTRFDLWKEVRVPEVWKEMPDGLGGYSWYRTRVQVPRTWQGRQLSVFVEAVDDAREIYCNGRRIGGNGSLPPHFRSGLGDRDRHPLPEDAVRFGDQNLIAIRVYNNDGRSGFNVAAPVLFGGDEAIRLEGTWQLRPGDDLSWGAPEELSAAAGSDLFARLEAAIDVDRTLRRLPGEEGPLSPEQSLARFTTPGDLVVELVLSEPAIGQPLDMKFDERGRLWVMNYKQYPNPAGLTAVSRDKHLRTVYDKVPPPPPHGVRGNDAITIHEDTDGDGRFDRHQTFIDGLNIATSFARGRGGLYVLSPPYLLFYPDRNDDDVPDADPEVLLEGFGLEDSHSVANNLTWGPDGWLYAAQGSTVTGQIKRYGSKDPPMHSMGQLIWRYHPESRQYEIFAEGGGNTFGVEIDSKGRIYSGHNGGDTRGFHYVQGGYYQKGFGKHGELSNPYAFGFFPQMKHHSVPRFTHTFIIYEGAALSVRFAGRLFGVGPLQSHVICSAIQPAGSTFATEDLEAILTSQDPWFRPVQIRVGPDGAIYVADFHEQRIDHASHYQGRVTPDTGRIYRLRDPHRVPSEPFDYRGLTSQELVQLLSHENKWHRRMALRLLADRRDATVRAQLLEKLEQNNGQLPLESLWALYLSGGFNEDVALRTLEHPDPYVRLWTIRLVCDDRHVSDALAERLARQAHDEPNIETRCQLASSARRLNVRHALPIVTNLLAHDDRGDTFLPLLAWWALEAHANDPGEVVVGLFDDPAFWELPLVRDVIAERLMRRFASAGSQTELLRCARLLERAPSSSHVQRLLRGFEEAYAGRPLTGLPDELLAAMAKVGGGSLAIRLRRVDPAAVEQALQQIADPGLPVHERAGLIEIFGQIDQPQHVAALLEVARQTDEQLIRAAVFNAIQAYDDPDIASTVLDLYGRLSDVEKALAEALLVSRRTWSHALLDAVAAGKVDRAGVAPAVVQQLLLHQDSSLAQRVAELWPDAQNAPNEALQAEVKRVGDLLASAAGNPYNGKRLFLEHCGKCHQLFSDGGRIGPDLTPYKRDDLERMLLNIIHPNLEIREGFENVVVLMEDGRTINGLIADQDQRVIVLKSPEGQSQLLRRGEIDDMQAIPNSIMPEGVLKPLHPQQIRDLFAYLRASQPLP